MTKQSLKSKDDLYSSPRYKAWRLAVFRRDGYKCKWCGKSGKSVRLQADHVKPKAAFPELMYKLSNGRTLCKECHKKTCTYGFRAANYKGIKL